VSGPTVSGSTRGANAPPVELDFNRREVWLDLFAIALDADPLIVLDEHEDLDVVGRAGKVVAYAGAVADKAIAELALRGYFKGQLAPASDAQGSDPSARAVVRVARPPTASAPASCATSRCNRVSRYAWWPSPSRPGRASIPVALAALGHTTAASTRSVPNEHRASLAGGQ
jgi:hypothetical protein